MDRDMLAQVAAWARVPPGVQALQIPRLSIRLIRLQAKPLEIPVFNADITFNRGGALKKAVFSDEKLRVEFAPKDRLWDVSFSAHGWQPPLGPRIEFDDLAFSAAIDGQQATFTGIEGSIGRGTLKGTAKASWQSNIRVEGEFNLENGNLDRLLPAFTQNFTATGTVNVKGNYVLQGENIAALFDKPYLSAGFSAKKGALNNVDIVHAIQAPSREGVRGGKTVFTELAGSLRVSDDSYAYRSLRLASGPMNAAGNVDIAPGGALSGRITAEVGSKSIVVARGSLNVGGTVQTPSLGP
jgi:autotransporter translocation and assembly factor TamB